jgi:hypothetical protein
MRFDSRGSIQGWKIFMARIALVTVPRGDQDQNARQSG